MISGAYFDDLVSHIFRYVGDDQYEVYEGFIFSKCYSNFPDLYFMFDEKWIKVEASEYVFDVSTADDGSNCLVLIIGLDLPYNVFGTPIFQGYYTVHDQDGNGDARLGYVPNNISGKPPLQKGRKPAYFLNFDEYGSTFA